jgi:hypothetical protein
MNPFYTDLMDRFHELHSDIEKALDALPAEALDWKPGAEMNSTSVLITHLTGAERFLVGDIVMGESSQRDRQAEFHAEGVGKEALRQRLHETDAYTSTALETLSLSDLEAPRKHPRDGHQLSVGWALLHALEHVATHAGHLDITVQLWQQRVPEGKQE